MSVSTSAANALGDAFFCAVRCGVVILAEFAVLIVIHVVLGLVLLVLIAVEAVLLLVVVPMMVAVVSLCALVAD